MTLRFKRISLLSVLLKDNLNPSCILDEIFRKASVSFCFLVRVGIKRTDSRIFSYDNSFGLCSVSSRSESFLFDDWTLPDRITTTCESLKWSLRLLALKFLICYF